MHYLIDGYNLLFRTIKARGSDDLKTQREVIVEELSKKLRIAGIHSTIVFDSHFQMGPGERRVVQGVDIYFTSEGETADDYIVDTVRKSPLPQEITVVSSDQKLAWRSRLKGARSLSVEDFQKILERIYQKKRKTLTKIVPPPQLPSPPKKVTLEERYEKLFEERLINEPPPTRQKLTGKADKPAKQKKEEKPFESDYERWLKAFGANGD